MGLTKNVISELQLGTETIVPCLSLKEAEVIRVQLHRFSDENRGISFKTKKISDANGDWQFLKIVKYLKQPKLKAKKK